MRMTLVVLAAAFLFAVDGYGGIIGSPLLFEEDGGEGPDSEEQDVQDFLNNLDLDFDDEGTARGQQDSRGDESPPARPPPRTPGRAPDDARNNPGVPQTEDLAPDSPGEIRSEFDIGNLGVPAPLPGPTPARTPDLWKGLESEIMNRQPFHDFGGEESTTELKQKDSQRKSPN